MAPATILLDCMKTEISIKDVHGNPNMMSAVDAVELTAFVTFLSVAVSRLDRRAVAVAIDPVARASALLNASATGHRTVRPFGPGRPAVHARVVRLKTRMREHVSKCGQRSDELHRRILKLDLRVPQRGQHSPSGTVALAQGMRGQEISRHTVAEFCE